MKRKRNNTPKQQQKTKAVTIEEMIKALKTDDYERRAKRAHKRRKNMK